MLTLSNMKSPELVALSHGFFHAIFHAIFQAIFRVIFPCLFHDFFTGFFTTLFKKGAFLAVFKAANPRGGRSGIQILPPP